MSRAILIVLDSFGCGGAPDAADFGDEGADTLGHIAEACAAGRADRAALRSGPLRLPNLWALGLGEAALASTGRRPQGFPAGPAPMALHGCVVEQAPGKDTPTGHWEIAGAGPEAPLGFFPAADPCFPPALTTALAREAGLPGLLGNRPAAGATILEELGEESLRSGKPICYTSVDSVFQIAAHEEAFGLERLYEVCRIARRLCDPLRIGRVIARPFLGASSTEFRRTPHRKDFAIPAPPGNLLDRAGEAGRAVLSFGKIGDIFDHRNTGREIKAASDSGLLDALAEIWPSVADGGLAFVNLVDCDTEFGHRRDVAGYAAALEAFDARLPLLEALLQPGDAVVFTADHGNDPTWRGTDHTRENAPLLCWGPDLRPRPLGRRRFADIGASLAHWLGLAPTAEGRSFFA